MATQFLRCRRRSSLVTAVRFSNGQEAFPLTTAAQNMYAFLRKSPLCRSHFFEWLKTAISSTACGRVTLKSLLPQGAYAPHVHPRLRKRLARCTLDCGFKTSESPALRGFEAGPRALATAALYLVLKSNAFRHSKNLPVKFGFSPKTVPANIAKKLPPQVPSQTISHHDFQLLAQMARACFCRQKWVHLAFAQRIAHKGTHGETGGVSDGGGITALGSFRTFTNIPGPGVRTAYFAALGSWPGGALEERRKPSGQRCAYARRCPEASRPRWAA